MKAFKIRVPENDVLPRGLDVGRMSASYFYKNHDPMYFNITRAGIHELVQKHAESLGYYVIPYAATFDNSEYGICVYYPGHTDKEAEISWQDFLKLTKEDVMDGTPINENLQSAQKNERNEKAWEILKIIVKERYAGLKEVGYLHYDTVTTDIHNANFYADEFLKQAGKP